MRVRVCVCVCVCVYTYCEKFNKDMFENKLYLYDKRKTQRIRAKKRNFCALRTAILKRVRRALVLSGVGGSPKKGACGISIPLSNKCSCSYSKKSPQSKKTRWCATAPAPPTQYGARKGVQYDNLRAAKTRT